LVYFLKGELPWQGLQVGVNKEDRYRAICDKKLEVTVDQLCEGIPEEFGTLISYARSLRFTDQPDYSYIRKIFRNLFTQNGFLFDSVFDWTEGDEDDVRVAF
jgi:hypothetical protein